MSLLSKAEVQFLQGQKRVSKSYEYKLTSIIKKKLSLLVDKELPLLVKLLTEFDFDVTLKYNDNHNSSVPSRDLTKNSKVSRHESFKIGNGLTKISKKFIQQASQNNIKAPGPGFEPGSRE
jgi:hypothetical protein